MLRRAVRPAGDNSNSAGKTPQYGRGDRIRNDSSAAAWRAAFRGRAARATLPLRARCHCARRAASGSAPGIRSKSRPGDTVLAAGRSARVARAPAALAGLLLADQVGRAGFLGALPVRVA